MICLGKYLAFYISYMTLKQFYAIGIIFPYFPVDETKGLKRLIDPMAYSNQLQYSCLENPIEGGAW